jgi:hypothetical protein
MPFPNPQTVGQKWSQRAGAAGAAYAAGVQNTTKDPTALAAAQAQKMLNGVTQAVTSGYWQRRLQDVGANGWKQAVQAKQANYGTGVAAAESKYVSGISSFFNYMGPTLAQIENMPKTSLADSIARATTWIQAAANYQKP